MNYLNKMMKLKNDHKSNDKDKNQNVKAFQIEINNNNILFRFIDINKLKYNMNKYIANKDLNNNNYQNINDGLKNENFIQKIINSPKIKSKNQIIINKKFL